MKIDVEKLSPKELKSLLIAAEQRRKLLASRRPAKVVRRELLAVAAYCGYTIEELFVGETTQHAASVKRPSRRRSGKVAPKYRDPDNKRNTWSGRGRMPTWLAERTKHGRSVADFLIPGLAKPTAKIDSIGQKTVFKEVHKAVEASPVDGEMELHAGDSAAE